MTIIVLPQQHDVGANKEYHNDKRAKDKSCDKASSHTLLPIFSSLLRLRHHHGDASFWLDKAITFTEIKYVELLLQLDGNAVDRVGQLRAKVSQSLLTALFGQAESTDQLYGNMSHIELECRIGGQVAYTSLLAHFLRA